MYVYKAGRVQPGMGRWRCCCELIAGERERVVDGEGIKRVDMGQQGSSLLILRRMTLTVFGKSLVLPCLKSSRGAAEDAQLFPL